MEREYEVGLYKHNKIAYENVCKMFETENKVCIIQATGTGKSFVALQLMYDFLKNNPDKHIKFFAPQNGILEQLREHIRTLNVDSNIFRNVEFLTYQSLLNMTRKEIEDMDIDLMITDEFHRLGAPEWQKRLDLIEKTHPNLKVFGMSATPVRARGTANEEDVSETFFEGNVANRYELYQALADGILPTPNYRVAITVLSDECDDLEERIKNGKASNEEKKEYMEMLSDIRKRISEGESVDDILKKYVKPDGKYIYFCSRGSDVKELQDRISSIYKDVDYEFYYVHSNEQSTQVNNLNSNNFYNNKTMDGGSAEGKLRIMFALDMYNEGIHVPDIDGVIMGRSTSSDILFYQQLGRALAVKGTSEKDFHPLVIDLVNNIGAIEELYNRVLQEKENSKDQLTSEEREKEERDFDKFNMAINFGLSDEIINVLDALNKLNSVPSISGLSFEEKIEEAYDYLQENKCLPMKKDKTIKFSDGVIMGNWLGLNQSKLKKKSEYNEKALAILNELNNRKGLSFDDKLDETYGYLQKYSVLPMSKNQMIKFSDGVIMSNWLSLNKSKLKKKSEYNEKALAIINELNARKGLSFDRKLEKVYEYLQKHNALPVSRNKTIKFSDGVIMSNWLNSNKSKLEEISKYNKIAQAIINELNSRKGLCFEDKIEEVYEYVQKYNALPMPKDKTIKFSDGVLMGNWLNKNRLKIAKMSKDDETALVIINKLNSRMGLSFEDKIEEVYEYLRKNKSLPNTNDKQIKFSDGVLMGSWFTYQRLKLEEASKNNKKAEVIVNELNSRKGLSFEKRLEEVYEYLLDCGNLPVISDKYICFSDNKSISNWLSRNRQKIYELYLTDDALAVKFVNLVLEIKPKYFDKVKEITATKEEFEKGKKKKTVYGRKK